MFLAQQFCRAMLAINNRVSVRTTVAGTTSNVVSTLEVTPQRTKRNSLSHERLFEN